jgi:uncharacterized flavoprotein (TIGR03862 family)
LERFDADDLRAWAEDLGQATFVGSTGRVFLTEFRAGPLLRAWLERLDQLGVSIHVRHRLVNFDVDGASQHVTLEVDSPEGPRSMRVDAVLLSLGGASWPSVGSDGNWVTTLVNRGVRITPLSAANCGVRVSWSHELLARHEGAPLKNVSITVGATTMRGEAVITATGLESGVIYALSDAFNDALAYAAPIGIFVDLKPDLSLGVIAERLRSRRPKASLSTVLTRQIGLDPAGISLLREATANQIPSDPTSLASLIKRVPLQVDGLESLDRAISTRGGVAFEAIDENFMIRVAPGVFVAGEMLDWSAPTGGYLLQATFSTAAAAASAIATWCDQSGTGTTSTG